MRNSRPSASLPSDTSSRRSLRDQILSEAAAVRKTSSTRWLMREASLAAQPGRQGVTGLPCLLGRHGRRRTERDTPRPAGSTADAIGIPEMRFREIVLRPWNTADGRTLSDLPDSLALFIAAQDGYVASNWDLCIDSES